MTGLLQTLSARALAVVTMLTMVLSAFPAPFFTPEAEAATPQVLFSDGFEYDDDDIDFSNWSDVDTPPWDISGGSTHEGSFRAQTVGTDSSQDLFLRKDLDTSGYQNITLTFWYKTPVDSGLEGNDEFLVYESLETRPNGSIPFSGVETLAEADNTTSWTKKTVTFSSQADNNPDFKFRFGLFAGAASSDVVHIDDVVVTGEPIEEATTQGSCTPENEVAGPTDIENTDTGTGEYFDTIQDAIDDCDTDNGDTIEVTAGTHTENVTVNKELTLDGTNSASINGRVRIESANTTLQNFTIDAAGTSVGVPVFIPETSSGADILIENNTITNTDVTGNSNSAGISVDTADTVTIRDNTIENISASNSNNKTGQGILVGNTASDGSWDNVTIENNTIQNITGAKGAYGVIVNMPVTNLSVVGNTIDSITGDADTDGSGWASGIGLDADTTAAVVTNNVVQNVSADTGAFAAFGIIGQSSSAAESITVEYNDFLTDPAAENRTAGDVDLTKNWWGSTEGPSYDDNGSPVTETSGGTIFQTVSDGSVAYDPWLCGPFAAEPGLSEDGACEREIENVTIVAEKIVCADESMLPNGDLGEIAADTATEYVSQHEGCELVSDWQFQWALGGISSDNAPNNASVLAEPWLTSAPTDETGATTMTIGGDQLGDATTISVREELQNGFIPFTGVDGSSESAELYCTGDASNYDNLEWIQNVQTDETYHCVAWNVAKTADVELCKADFDTEAPLPGWQLTLLGEKVGEVSVDSNGEPYTIDGVPAGDYVLKASGEYVYRAGGFMSDAAFSERKAGDDGYGTYPYQPWRATNLSSQYLGLQVNGDASVWGTVFSPSHTYYTSWNPTDSTNTGEFQITDNHYGDNSGSILVEAFTGYTGTTGDNGCVIFEDVPYGDYQVEELLQPDWQNESGLGELVVSDETVVEGSISRTVVNRDVSEEPTATLVAHKIICSDESDLPNGSLDVIDAATAQTWVDEHDSCSFASGWNFQWAAQNTGNPDDALPESPLYGPAGEEWTTFGPTDSNGMISTEVPESAFVENEALWMREVLQEGYLPFTYGPGNQNNENDETAEFYCHTDAKNYDNYDRVDDLAADENYYCVAWNHSLEQCTLEAVSDTGTVVVENDDYAVETYDGNTRWTASIPGISKIPEWIWGTEEVENPEQNETYTFRETFTVENPTNAYLNIAADNTYRVTVNGTELAHVTQENNYMSHSQDAYTSTEVTPLLQNGENTMEIEVTNLGMNNGDYRNNPAGALYQLVVDAESQCEITTEPEYEEPMCKAVSEARVVLRDTAGNLIQNGTGNLVEEVRLGDGTIVDFGEWFPLSEANNPGESADWIDDAETVSNFTNPADIPQLFVSREGNGEVKVGLYGEYETGGDVNYEGIRATLEFNDVAAASVEDMPGDFALENHSESDSVSSNDNFDAVAVVNDGAAVDFDMWVDVGSDGFTVTLDDDTIAACADDTTPQNDSEYRIDGYKYEGSGETATPKAGWTIYAKSPALDETLSTTTDKNGYFYFDVSDETFWQVYEANSSGWEQIEVRQNSYPAPYQNDTWGEYCGFEGLQKSDKFPASDYDDLSTIGNEPIIEAGEGATPLGNRCDFYNEATEEGDNSENPTDPDDGSDTDSDSNESDFDEGDNSRLIGRTSSGGDDDEPGRVAGIATDEPQQCGPILNTYMSEGSENNRWEVFKLQLFLMREGYQVPLSGEFGQTTDQAVRAFQADHQGDVLDPWYEAGIVSHNNPTGRVYMTTRWKINNIYCPGSEAMPNIYEG